MKCIVFALFQHLPFFSGSDISISISAFSISLPAHALADVTAEQSRLLRKARLQKIIAQLKTHQPCRQVYLNDHGKRPSYVYRGLNDYPSPDLHSSNHMHLILLSWCRSRGRGCNPLMHFAPHEHASQEPLDWRQWDRSVITFIQHTTREIYACMKLLSRTFAAMSEASFCTLHHMSYTGDKGATAIGEVLLHNSCLLEGGC